MKAFRYQAVGPQSDAIKGEIEAADRKSSSGAFGQSRAFSFEP